MSERVAATSPQSRISYHSWALWIRAHPLVTQGNSGVEWHRCIDRHGRKSAPTCSTSNASAPRPSGQTPASWSRHNSPEQSNSKYRPSGKQKPNATVAQSEQEARCGGSTNSRRATASRERYLQWTTRRPDAECWWCNHKTQTREHLFENCRQWEKPAEGSVGGGQRRNRPGQRPVQDLGALRRREM